MQFSVFLRILIGHFMSGKTFFCEKSFPLHKMLNFFSTPEGKSIFEKNRAPVFSKNRSRTKNFVRNRFFEKTRCAIFFKNRFPHCVVRGNYRSVTKQHAIILFGWTWPYMMRMLFIPDRRPRSKIDYIGKICSRKF